MTTIVQHSLVFSAKRQNEYFESFIIIIFSFIQISSKGKLSVHFLFWKTGFASKTLEAPKGKGPRVSITAYHITTTILIDFFKLRIVLSDA